MGCSLRGMGDYWEEVTTRVGGLSRFTTKKKTKSWHHGPLIYGPRACNGFRSSCQEQVTRWHGLRPSHAVPLIILGTN